MTDLPRDETVRLSGVYDFVQGSNAIEGIIRLPLPAEIKATSDFLLLPKFALEDVSALQAVCAPGKPLRDRVGMNVRVGDHVAPMGGRSVVVESCQSSES